MRVVYILPTGPLYGDNIALRTILPHLVKCGVEPLIVTRTDSDSLRAFKEMGYPCIVHDWYYSTKRTQPLWRATMRQIHRWEEQHIRLRNSEYRRILSEVRAFAPDLIHTNCSFTDLGVRLADDLHLPHVMHIREYGQPDSSSHYPTDAIFGRSCQKKNRYNITITRDIQSYLHLPQACSRPIYDGVFQPEQSYRLLEQKQPYFLYVGRIEEKKGVHLVIDAFARFSRRMATTPMANYRLLIAGSGTDEAYHSSLMQQITSAGLNDKVQMLGYRTDVQQLMQEATALLVPSQFEAFGFISAEALFQGCPVIGRNVAGTKEQYENVADIPVQTPMFYPFSTIEECAEAMLSAAQAHPTHDDMQLLHDRVASLYPAEQSAQQVYAYYQDILPAVAQAASTPNRKTYPLMQTTALVTQSYRDDFDACRLLCESIDRFAPDYDHFIFVNDEDYSLFAETMQYGNHRVYKKSVLLPKYLSRRPFRFRGRAFLLSPFTLPVRGWIVQQICKLAVFDFLPAQYEAVLHFDSELVLMRPLTEAAYRDGHLYHLHKRLVDEHYPSQRDFIRAASDLLALTDEETRALQHTGYMCLPFCCERHNNEALLRQLAKKDLFGDWKRALCNTYRFSEFYLYAIFTELRLNNAHQVLTEQRSFPCINSTAYHTEEELQRCVSESLEDPNIIGVWLQKTNRHQPNPSYLPAASIQQVIKNLWNTL